MHSHLSSSLACALVGLGLAGCGGVDDSKRISDLDTMQAEEVCRDLSDDYPERTVMCGDAQIKIGFAAGDCDSVDMPPPGCTATVGDVRDCADALYSQTDAEVCADAPPPAACAHVLSC